MDHSLMKMFGVLKGIQKPAKILIDKSRDICRRCVDMYRIEPKNHARERDTR